MLPNWVHLNSMTTGQLKFIWPWKGTHWQRTHFALMLWLVVCILLIKPSDMTGRKDMARTGWQPSLCISGLIGGLKKAGQTPICKLKSQCVMHLGTVWIETNSNYLSSKTNLHSELTSDMGLFGFYFSLFLCFFSKISFHLPSVNIF